MYGCGTEKACKRASKTQKLFPLLLIQCAFNKLGLLLTLTAAKQTTKIQGRLPSAHFPLSLDHF